MHPTKLFNVSFRLCLRAFSATVFESLQLSGEIVRSITHTGCHPCTCGYYLWKSAPRTEIKFKYTCLRRQQRAVAKSALTVSRPTLKYLAHSTCKHAPADMLPIGYAAKGFGKSDLPGNAKHL